MVDVAELKADRLLEANEETQRLCIRQQALEQEIVAHESGVDPGEASL